MKVFSWKTKVGGSQIKDFDLLVRPGFHYTTNATTTTQTQSDYKVEQSSFTLIALFWLKIGRCRGRNWLNGNQALLLRLWNVLFRKKNEYSLEAHRFKSLVSIKLFTWNTVTIMGVQDKNTKNSIKSKNYPKSKTLREFKKLYIDWLV